jgi:carnosine N-methyltransferase
MKFFINILGQMSMIAGDFIQVYDQASQHNQWDCVCTCFFIDCANNIIDFIEIIHKILKPGGVWINLGPLTYHYCDVPNELSIELSYDLISEIIKKSGFYYLKENLDVRTKYSQNVKSMSQLEYKSVFFVVKKKENN